MQEKLLLYNRITGAVEEERIFVEKFKNIFYGTLPGRIWTNLFLKRKIYTGIYKLRNYSKRSRRKILPFIRQYNINMEEAEYPAEAYRSFNDFFTRRLKPGVRPIDYTPGALIAPADSRLLAMPIAQNAVITIKGMQYKIEELAADKSLMVKYIGGHCLIFRLTPADYHRFCYIDDGWQTPVRTIKGFYHISAPQTLVLKSFPLYHKNYRQCCSLRTGSFNEVLQVEIGAMSVGKINQHKPGGGACKKGEEKGYFEFGASTIALLFQPGTVQIAEDIITHSKQGIETLVKYGSNIGKKPVLRQGNS